MDLARQTELIEQFLNNKHQHSNPQVVNSRLFSYFQTLQLTNSRVTLEVTLNSLSCAMCPGRVTDQRQTLILECGCQARVCNKDCFRKYVHTITNGTLLNLDSVQCPRCGNPIGSRQCISNFTEWEILSCNQQALSPNTKTSTQPTTFKCQIHLDDCPISEDTGMTCGHKVCKDCVEGYISNSLDEGKCCITCPVKDCLVEIPVSLVRNLTPKLYNRYNILSLQAGKGTLESEKEVLFECPSTDCPNFIVAAADLFSFQCPLCQKTYCPQCKYAVHLPQTCKEYFDFLQAEQARKHTLLKNEKETEDFFRNQPGNVYRQCPKCKVWIERMAGCKYMSCQSQTCQGKTYFCITCGQQLAKDHGAHTCTVTGYDFR